MSQSTSGPRPGWGMADSPTSGIPVQWGTPQDHAACGDAIAAARALGARDALLSLAAEVEAMVDRTQLPGTPDEVFGYGSGILQGIALMARRRAQEGPGTPLGREPVSKEGQERSVEPGPAPSDPVESLVDYGPAIDAGIAKAATLNISPGFIDSPELIGRLIAAEVLRVATPIIAAAERARICAVLGNNHYAIFTSLTWEVEHSTECALSGQVAECTYHKAIARVAEEYSEPGRWGRWRIKGIGSEGLPDLERAEGETG